MKFGEVALDFEQETGQRVSIALHFLKDAVVQFQYLIEVAEQRLTLKDKRIGVDTHIAFLVLVVLIVDFADDFLQNILQGDDAAGAAELIDDDGYMYLVLLKLAQQVVDFLCLRHEVWRADERLPPESRTF